MKKEYEKFSTMSGDLEMSDVFFLEFGEQGIAALCTSAVPAAGDTQKT